MSVELGAVLDALYSHEINFRIHCLWDGGIDVGIGNTAAFGAPDAETCVDTGAEAAEWLRSKAAELYGVELPEPVP